MIWEKKGRKLGSGTKDRQSRNGFESTHVRRILDKEKVNTELAIEPL